MRISYVRIVDLDLSYLLELLDGCNVFRELQPTVLFEETGEVLRVFKSESFGGLCGVETADQQALSSIDNETLDDLRGTLAVRTAHDVAEIAGRKVEF